MTSQPTPGLVHVPGPLLSTDLPTSLWPRCAHCDIPVDGNLLRETTPTPGAPARSWHADKPDCRAAGEETVEPAPVPHECPDHPGVQLVDGSCEACAWHDDHADLMSPSAQFEMDQVDEARDDAGELD